MVTISTNADPGQGSDGDAIYVDDLSFIYDAGIASSRVADGKVDLTLKGHGAFANTVYGQKDGRDVATVTVYSDDLKKQETKEFDLGKALGINTVKHAETPAAIYNINGQRVSTMRHGQVYILKQGQQTSKKLY